MVFSIAFCSWAVCASISTPQLISGLFPSPFTYWRRRHHSHLPQQRHFRLVHTYLYEHTIGIGGGKLGAVCQHLVVKPQIKCDPIPMIGQKFPRGFKGQSSICGLWGGKRASAWFTYPGLPALRIALISASLYRTALT